ncbi:MAG: transglycosylase domain-containing protein, partial [Hyphomicrobiales bacterium]|nr:transglycosylase domain-containing protein [Hyphomicrobiales bacterium]
MSARARAFVSAGLACTLMAGALGARAFETAVEAFAPADMAPALSTVAYDRKGSILRVFATPDGRRRLPVRLREVDPRFLKSLLAVEDRRYWRHGAVDWGSVARAAWQWTSRRRIVSGASTISMQYARLLATYDAKPAPAGALRPDLPRRLWDKVAQTFGAFAVERALGKKAILRRYLEIAPYGGDLQGVAAASRAWFGKSPRRLTWGEAALLVALPQAPEARRPD